METSCVVQMYSAAVSANPVTVSIIAVVDPLSNLLLIVAYRVVVSAALINPLIVNRTWFPAAR